MEVRQSLNFDCAVRRDWKELERWVSSASSWVFSSCRRGTGREVISIWPGWPPCFEAMVCGLVVVVTRSFAGRGFVKVGGKFTWARFWRGGFGVG